MPKSKKKKFSNKNGPPKPKDRMINMVTYTKDHRLNAYTSLCLPDLGFDPDHPDSVLYTGNEPKQLTLFKNSANQSDSKNNPDQKRSELTDTENILYGTFARYMKHIKDFDDMLNPYVTKSEVKPYDTIDISELILETKTTKKDIVRQMNDILNDDNFRYDPSYTWSTNDYLLLRVSQTLEYGIKRLLYDDANHSARYLVVEYRVFYGIDHQKMQIPTLWFILQITDAIIDTDAKTIRHADNMMPQHDNWNGQSYFTENNTIETGIMKSYIDYYGSQFKALRLNCGGILSLYDMLTWVQSEERIYRNSKPVYKLITSFLKSVCSNDLYKLLSNWTPEFQVKYHMCSSASLIIAALVITNKRLKDKKLSRPIKTASSFIKHETEIILENKPERRTRRLGDTIRITSEERPSAPTVEKIIHYHKPEWERCAHLRTLKSGKQIKIDKCNCKRRCVDMKHVINKQTITGTDYTLTATKQSDNVPTKKNKEQGDTS